MTGDASISRGHFIPAALPGFEHIGRYWDPVHEAIAAKILPGDFYVTRHEEMIVTVLGSCVSACIRDAGARIGGMNHFMLPTEGELDRDAWARSDAARYGNYAMERMINEILKLGGRRDHLEIKVFGGGRVLAGLSDVGAKNIAFVIDYLREEGLAIAAQDLGDVFPRKVYYYLQSGRVRVKKIREVKNETIARREREYLDVLKKKPIAGAVELF